jgi:hypothetical protein
VAEQLYADGIAYCDDHDIATYGTFLCSERTGGTLMARRGEATAWEYLDQAMADAERTGEPQSIVPVRLARAEACVLTQ